MEKVAVVSSQDINHNKSWVEETFVLVNVWENM